MVQREGISEALGASLRRPAPPLNRDRPQFGEAALKRSSIVESESSLAFLAQWVAVWAGACTGNWSRKPHKNLPFRSLTVAGFSLS